MADIHDTVAKCEALVANAKDVSLNEEKLTAFAIDLGDIDHGTAPAITDEIKRADLSAVLICWNAINFSYFPDPGDARWTWQHPDTSVVHGADDEANGVFAALTYLQSQSHRPLADGAFLANLTAADLRERVFPSAASAGPLPLLELRTQSLNEVGKMLTSMGTSPIALVDSAASAIDFVATVTAACPLYSDIATWTPKGDGGDAITVAFHKRAQLCASMLGAFGVKQFAGLGDLTVFADYRLPQLFRATGVFELSDRLAGVIERGEPVVEGSREELELRAATVVAGEKLRAAIEKRMQEAAGDGARCHANVLDYVLWKLAVKRDVEGSLPPFHRTRTHAY